jgi:hypothetical protein
MRGDPDVTLRTRAASAAIGLILSWLFAAPLALAQGYGSDRGRHRGGGGAPELWFSSGDDLEVRGVVAHPDFMRLFDSPSPWPTGLAHIDVMQLRAPWFLRMPPETGQKVVNFLKGHDIALAVPLGFVSSDTCGQGVEGIGTARGQNVYPREMKKRGIDLTYVVMDEPLFHGHDYNGPNACRFSIEQVVDSVATNVRMVRSYYPDMKFIWVEPPQSLVGGAQEMAQFLDLYKARLGEYPVSVRFDIAWGQHDKWHTEWHAVLPGFIQALKARGIGYGIIFDAGHLDGRVPNTDAGWIASAKADVADWMSTVRDKPNQIVIQTWSPNPVRIVPESDLTTMTGYLKWFVTQQH